MKPADFFLASLFALVSACASPVPASELNNLPASLPASFHFEKLGLRVIASSVNKRAATMATLYGNDQALTSALAGPGTRTAGEVFALITWQQQDDPNWFGAKIPGPLQTIEMLKTLPNAAGPPTVKYQRFAGQNLVLETDTLRTQERIAYILAQQPSIMP